MTQGTTNTWARTPRMVVMSALLVVAMLVGAGLNQIIVGTGSASDRLESASNYSIIGETYEIIRDNYVLQENFSDEELVWGATWGMVETLGDTGHTYFMNPEETIDSAQNAANELIGIGVSLDLSGDLPVINYPMKNSPALEAGIMPGDTILAIDGVDITDMDPVDAVELISGEEGTDVTLVLQHVGEDETYEVTITRSLIKTDPVQYAMLPNNVLWLRLDQFTSGSSSRVVEGLQWGIDNGMTGVILDLRGNPGGYVIEALGIVSQFLPGGTPVYQEADMNGVTRTVSTIGNKGLWLEGDLTVLVDENSASSSEMTSSALMETGRAELVGQTTAGTGTVLLQFDLSDGSSVMIGVELFLTGQGTDIYMVGIHPTHEVEFSENPNEYAVFPISLGVDEGELSEAEFEALEDDQLHFAWDLLQN